MKHLKTYEKYNIKDIKKYTVYLYNNIDYYIDHIKECDEDFIIYEMLYNYDGETKELNNTEITSDTKFNFNEYILNVLFTSDNLDQCLDFVKMNVDLKKYNI